MPWFDLSLEQLASHAVTATEPADLDGWWARRLAQARSAAAPPVVTEYQAAAYGPLRVYDVEFSGDRGDRVRGWYLLPPGAAGEPLPLVVKFVGYGGGRGLPVEHALLPAAGYATFVMDVRGQGGRWTVGATGDPAAGPGAGPELSTVMTRGLARPEDYYYARLFTDAVRAVETAAALDLADRSRIAVSGASQGGALALATAALLGEVVAVCHADVPFLCDIARAVTLAPEPPYTEIAEFLANHTGLVDTALDTLRYVDCALLARRITADCLLSAGLMDPVCPPSTVFAAYNAIRSRKQIAVSQFGTHVVPAAQTERQLAHLRERLVSR
ncbi:MAG: acetylxylan esterase [Actinobacteria bacterium]|nr:acetylxylan esterase [Actinomycetota bacterium]MBO0785643.1 acetylxylan esterase [Actinomycetota bacterium]